MPQPSATGQKPPLSSHKYMNDERMMKDEQSKGQRQIKKIRLSFE